MWKRVEGLGEAPGEDGGGGGSVPWLSLIGENEGWKNGGDGADGDGALDGCYPMSIQSF